MKTRTELSLVLLLCVFLSSLLAAPFLHHTALYWDTARLFTLFRDPLQAMNRFGEFAWWYPHHQQGIPAYFATILNTNNGTTPWRMLLLGVAWALGRAGVFIQSFHAWYVFYFAALIPSFFTVVCWALSRHFFSSPTTRLALVCLAAFSPGVLFNLSDIGFLEPLSYSLCLIGAYLSFVKDPHRRSFFLLLGTCFIWCLSLNNAYLYWNLVFVPPLLLWIIFMPWPHAYRRHLQAWQTISIPQWIGFFAGSLNSVAPVLITLFQNSDVIQPALGGKRMYDFSDLSFGNPLEMFAASFPGFGFDWTTGREHFALKPISAHYHTAYYYLGLVAWPLALIGLLTGKRRLRQFILAALVFGCVGVILSTYSPFLSLLLRFETPLRACNHFSDVSFKAGTFLFIVFAVGLGLRRLERGGTRTWRLFFGLFVVQCFLVLGLFAWSYPSELFAIESFGAWLVIAFAYGVTFLWIFRSPSRRASRIGLLALVAVLFVDVTTNVQLYLRTIEKSTHQLDSGWRAFNEIRETPVPYSIGMVESTHPHYYANRFLMYRRYFELLRSGFPLGILPPIQLYSKARVVTDVDAMKGVEPMVLPVETRSRDLAPAEGSIESVERTFNTVRVSVRTTGPLFLFLRDAFSPYWTARVNGRQVPILRAFHHFKALEIPAGHSDIVFEFRPPWVAASLWAAYLSVFAAFACAIVRAPQFAALKRWKLQWAPA